MAAAGPLAQLSAPSTNGLGKLEVGALEGSNVDLTTELSNLITTQRAFEANSKVITTSDEVLQTLVNLKR
jgi:flagellar hook protein FlgE